MDTSPRELRHYTEHKKLSDIARHVAAICPQIDSCDVDARLYEVVTKCGFARHDLVAMRLYMQGTSFTVILLPLRLWYKPLWLHRAIELRNLMRRNGQRCIVAPASVVMKQPRLTNARLVAACVGYTVKVSDQVTLVDRLIETGGLSLQEASGLVEARDPAGAVLSMVSKRQLAIDTTKPIGPHSMLTAIT